MSSILAIFKVLGRSLDDVQYQSIISLASNQMSDASATQTEVNAVSITDGSASRYTSIAHLSLKTTPSAKTTGFAVVLIWIHCRLEAAHSGICTTPISAIIPMHTHTHPACIVTFLREILGPIGPQPSQYPKPYRTEQNRSLGAFEGK